MKPSYISAYTYEEVLKHEKLMTYWDSTNGYNDNMQGDQGGQGDPGTPDAPVVTDGAYTYSYEGMGGTETAQITLNDNGTVRFEMVGHMFLKDVYEGTYTREENTVTIQGLTNVDAASEYKLPGLWAWIDAATGDAVVTVDDTAGTFAPADAQTPDVPVDPDGPVVSEGAVIAAYTYVETNPMGLAITWTLTLKADGTYVLTEVNDFVGEVSYEGASYTVDGNTITCGPMASAPAVSEWAKAEGFAATIEGETFTPVVE